MSRRADTTSRRAVPLLVLALILLAALASPVRAAESGGDTATIDEPGLGEFEAIDAMIEMFETTQPWSLDVEVHFDALDHLLLEIALLQHLDAFTAPVPWFAADVHDAYEPWPDLPRRGTLDFLLETDGELARIKDEVNQQIGPAPALAFALDEIPATIRGELAEGTTRIVDPGTYAHALSEMLTLGNADVLVELGAANAALVADLPFELENPELASDLDPLRDLAENPPVPAPRAAAASPTTPTADVADVAETDTTATDDPTADTTADPPPATAADAPSTAVIVGSVAVAVSVAGALVWFALRRRSRRGHADADATDTVLEAHRRLTNALHERDVADIGEATAVALTDATDAFVFRQTPEGLRRVGDEVTVVGSALARVVETAQPLVTVVEDDPAVHSAAVSAVPLVSDGRVAGVLVARRPIDRPFDERSRRHLEMLAPALAGALASADTLGSFETMALVDGLTSLGNRRRLDGDLETTLSDALADDLPVAFAMIDVDHFKTFNDTHGHEAGDRALQAVARTIAETVRTSDVVYRYGGEEFSVLLPGATLDEATAAAERMRAAVEAVRIEGEETQPGGRLTISVGVSTLDAGDANGIKTRADEALYEAKARGRNRAVVA